MFVASNGGGARGGTRPAPLPPRPGPPSIPVRALVNPVAAPPRAAPPPSVPIRTLVNPVSRSAANTTGSPANATTQRLAKAIGGRPQPPPVTPARLALSRALLRLYGGPDRAFMLPTDPIQSNKAMLGQRNKVEQMQTQGQFNQTFTDLLKAGLLPKGAKQPPLIFTNHGTSGRSHENHGKIYLSPLERVAVANPNHGGGDGSLGTWAKETLIHELAHTLQSKKTLSSVPDREGGAQAYTDAATPRVLGPLPTNLDSNYTGYVNRARAKKGSQWIMQGQFR